MPSGEEHDPGRKVQIQECKMTDQPDEITRYYLEERNDFFGNAPLEHLMEALSPRIAARTDNRFVLAVDVGCCVGGFIERMSRICPEPNALILGVEPNPLNVEQLRGRSFSRRVEFVECAFSDAEGTATLSTISDHPENRAEYSLASLNGDGERIVGVPVITFNQLLERIGLSDAVIRLVKIDCEGHDTKVLRGMRDNLASIEYIVFESSDCLDDRRGPQENAPLERIVQFLDDHGFDTYKVGHRRLLQQNGAAWRDCFEGVKFHSNSFSLRKEDPLIQTLIDTDGFFLNR